MESEAPCCAHMRVVWTTEIDRAGLTHGWWKCSDCEAEFVPFARAVRAEEERHALQTLVSEFVRDYGACVFSTDDLRVADKFFEDAANMLGAPRPATP